MFTDVNVEGGTLSLRLDGIVPSEGFDSNFDTIQFFAADKTMLWAATYTSEEDYGWYHATTGMQVNGDPVDIGNGFVVNAGGADVSLLIAGEVRTNALAIAVPAGLSIIGNALPMGIELGQMIPNEKFDSDFDTIQFFNPNKTMHWSATYTSEENYGWYNALTGLQVNDYPLEPGDSVFAVVSGAGVVFSLPAIVIKD